MIKKIGFPLLIALLAISQVVVGLVGASGIRADDRKAAAAARHRAAVARETRAVAAYRSAVKPLVLSVFDAVQPLQDVDDAYATIRPGLNAARDDVLTHSGAGTALKAVSTTLATVKVPRTLTAPAAELTKNLAALSTAAADLAQATKAKPDAHGVILDLGAAFSSLISAESYWQTAVSGVFGTAGNALPTPSASRVAANGRRVPSKGSFLQAADLACARAGTSLAGLPDLSTENEILVNFPKEAKIDRTAVQALLTIPAPPSLSAGVQQLRIQLHANLALPDALEAMSTAFRRSDAAAYKAAARRFLATESSVRAASNAYRLYGASACAFFFDVDSDAKGTASSGGISA